jgi:hypothetical protein
VLQFHLAEAQTQHCTMLYLWGRLLMLTPCSWVRLAQLLKDFPTFHEPQCSLPYSAVRPSLSWARSVWSTHPTLSLRTVGLQMSSLPTLAFKSPNISPMWYFGNLSNTDHQFYLLSGQERSEQWHHITALSV